MNFLEEQHVDVNLTKQYNFSVLYHRHQCGWSLANHSDFKNWTKSKFHDMTYVVSTITTEFPIKFQEPASLNMTKRGWNDLSFLLKRWRSGNLLVQ